MTNKKDIYLLYILLALEFLILSKSQLIINSVLLSSKMFFYKIFPSLFPSMIIGNLIIKKNVFLLIPQSIKRVFNKVLRFTDPMTSIFIMSIFTGSPSNAMYINDYLNKGLITEKEAETLLCTTHFINPLFVIASIGQNIFNNKNIGVLLLFLLIMTNFIKAFILRGKKHSINKEIKTPKSGFIASFNEVIKSTINALLVIFAIIIAFNILLSLIENIFTINPFIKLLLNGILEMTSATVTLSSINLPFIYKFIISYLILSFGGLCIQMQTFSVITNKKIRYLKYLIFRLF